MLFKKDYLNITWMTARSMSSRSGGLYVGGPRINPNWAPRGKGGYKGSGYVVECVLGRAATGIDKWSVVVDDHTLRNYTPDTLPYFITDAVTQIAPFADSVNLRRDIGVTGKSMIDYDVWPAEFTNIGWYAGKAAYYPSKDFDSPYEEQLFCVIVTLDQLNQLRQDAGLDELSAL